MSERNNLLPDPDQDLPQVLSQDNYPFASSGMLFKSAKFGRDALEAAEDLLLIRPEIARAVITTISTLQGNQTNPKADEEPGKVHHESRSVIVDGHEVDPMSAQITREIAKRWGEGGDSFTYYGSVDSTPLFLRLVGYFCHLYGPDILQQSVIDKSGQTITVKDSYQRALKWLEDKLASSDLGLLEYQRALPTGLANQFWKDSITSLIDEAGHNANHEAPIAEISVQAYAYDSLLYAAEILGPDAPDQAKAWQKQAETLRQTVLSKYWLPEKKYFGVALDRDQDGKPRLITTPNSNPALLLDSRFFDDLSPAEQEKYISSIVEVIYSDSFLTDVGIRCRAKEYAGLIKFQEYHGPWSIWPKETFDVAKGLLRWGFPSLAEQLNNLIINSAILFNDYPEHIYVDPVNNHVYYGPQSDRNTTPEPVIIAGSLIPEKIQTWSLTAVMAILKQQIFVDQQKSPSDWQRSLEPELLKSQPIINIVTSQAEMLELYPPHPYLIDTELGAKLKSNPKEAILENAIKKQD